MRAPDFIVVGGGLLGLLTARALAREGARVALYDKGEPGREASWAGGGILAPLHPWRCPPRLWRLVVRSRGLYQRLAEELREETGIDPEWTPSGLLVLDPEPEEAERALAWAREHGEELRPVEGAELRELEPGLGPGHVHGLWLPWVAQIRNPRLLKALLRSLHRLGVEIRAGEPVVALALEGGRVTGVRTPQGLRPAGAVIVTAGAWTPLIRPLEDLPIRPVRGQMLLLRARPGALRRILLQGDRYLVPRRDGRVLAGSTVEEAGYDKSTDPGAAEALRAFAAGLVPALAGAPLERHWAGLRPRAEGGEPFIGPHPGLRSLYLCAGHFRTGVASGLGSADALVEQLAAATA